MISIPRACGEIPLDGSGEKWPAVPPEALNKLAIGPDQGKMSADFRLCWDDANIYFMADIVDATPMHNSMTDENLWNGDALEIFFGSEDLNKTGQFAIRRSTNLNRPTGV